MLWVLRKRHLHSDIYLLYVMLLVSNVCRISDQVTYSCDKYQPVMYELCIVADKQDIIKLSECWTEFGFLSSPHEANSLTLSFRGTVNVLLFLIDLSLIGSCSSSPTVSILSARLQPPKTRVESVLALTRQAASHSGAAIVFWFVPSTGQPSAFPEFEQAEYINALPCGFATAWYLCSPFWVLLWILQ